MLRGGNGRVTQLSPRIRNALPKGGIRAALCRLPSVHAGKQAFRTLRDKRLTIA
ncbi:hypothetical protein FHX76_002273 [Lysinibacter cavernae]|uniref:Uncharacterized protein n=1 Tax=Lysinibacter cavernae TaxID=1640652 RepID=A0A7X5R2U2_9MICO|nr:hypothetical protein [Lysinibacter cavernae]